MARKRFGTRNTIILVIIIFLAILIGMNSNLFQLYGGTPYESTQITTSSESMSGNVFSLSGDPIAQCEDRSVSPDGCSNRYCSCDPACIEFSPVSLSEKQKENFLGIRFEDSGLVDASSGNKPQYAGLFKNMVLDNYDPNGKHFDYYNYRHEGIINKWNANNNIGVRKILGLDDISTDDLEAGFSLCGANVNEEGGERGSFRVGQVYYDYEVECQIDDDCNTFASTEEFICVENFCVSPEEEQEINDTVDLGSGDDEQDTEDKEIISKDFPTTQVFGGVGLLIILVLIVLIARGRKK